MLVGLGSQMNDTVTILAWLFGLLNELKDPKKKRNELKEFRVKYTW